MDEAKLDLINGMLKRAGPCLEDLYFRCINERPLKDGIRLNLNFNSNLRSLRLNLAPDARYVASRCPPKWVLSTLERFQSPVAIKQLVLDIGIVDSISFKRADYRRWRCMTMVLSREWFPSLQRVRILATDSVANLSLVEDLAMQAIQGLGVQWVIEMTDNDESNALTAVQ
ncbi:hypothetical protein C0995_004803 [Termitomyces sp. Mi166|nr:hypothetical protein C0995_004803 [Termitomyces sp. Mi166\